MILRAGAPPVALLAAALLALAGCGGGNGGGTDALPQDDALVATEPGAGAPGAYAEDEVTLALENYETAEIIGTAVLTPAGEASTDVSVVLDVYPEGGSSAEIRRGACEEPQAEVAYEVARLEDGQGEGTVDAALDDLLATEHALWAVGPDDEDLGCALIAPLGAGTG